MIKSFLTVKEVAQCLSIKVKTVYSWAEQGKLPSYKVCGALRFCKADIETFVESCRVKILDPSRVAKKMIGKGLFSGHNRLDSGQRVP